MYKKLMIALCALLLSLTSLAVADGRDDHGKSGGAQPSDDQKRVRARLNGPAIDGETPSGTSVSRSQDGQNSFRVELEDVNLPDGTKLAVILVHEGNAMRVGVITLSHGSGELDLHSRDGDETPRPESGDVVVVRQGQMNRLAGVFF